MRLLGIDFGTKRVGVAVSDESQTLARELAIVSRSDAFQKLEEIFSEFEIERVVLGLPLNMSGEMTHKTEEVLAFKEKLESKFETEVVMQDERLSSVMAESLIGKREHVDSLAAQIILQNYLDSRKMGVGDRVEGLGFSE